MENNIINWLRNFLSLKPLDYPNKDEQRQTTEDLFVEREVERIAKEQYDIYVSEKQKWDKITEHIKDPELIKMCGPVIYEKTYPRCYRIYDDNTAKFGKGYLNINQEIQERYEQLLNKNLHNNTNN